MINQSRIVENTTSLFLSTLIVVSAQLILIKIFTTTFSIKDFGSFIVLRAISGLITGILVIGLPQVAIRFLPQLEINGSNKKILQFSFALVILYCIFFIVIFLVIWLYKPILITYLILSIPQAMLSERLFYFILLLSFSVGIYEIIISLYQGIRKMKWIALSQIIFYIAILIHIYFISNDLTIEKTLFLFSLYSLISSIWMVILFPFLIKNNNITDKPLRYNKKDIFSYWWIGILIRLIIIISSDFDKYILTFITGMEMIAYYNLSSKIAHTSRRLLQTSITPLQTEVSKIYEQRREPIIPDRLQLFIRIQVIISLWLGTTIFLLGKPLILIISTHEYLNVLPLLYILLLTLPLSSILVPLEAVLRGLNHLKPIFWGNIIWIIIYFCSLSLFFSMFGLIGLGLSHIIAMFFQTCWIVYTMCKNKYIIKISKVVYSIKWGIVSLFVCIIFSLLLPGRIGFNPSNSGILLGLVILSISTIVLLRGNYILNNNEKHWFLRQFNNNKLTQFIEKMICYTA